MKPSKIISLSAVTTAFSVIFLTAGAYIDVLDLSCLFLSSLVIMLPLAKGSFKTAIFSYLATAILTLLTTIGTGKFAIVTLYSVFFGLHPIINYLEETKKFNKVITLIIKDVWFIITLFLMYFTFTLFTDLPEFIENIIIYVIIIGGGIVFIAYDFIIKRFQTITNSLILRLKL